MADQTDKPKLGTRPPLGLKRTVETGKVKQSFSHGRSNTVVVEVKKRRILGRPGEAPPAPAPEPVDEAPKQAPKPAAPAAPTPRKPSAAEETAARKEVQVKLLREAEESRLTALEEARRREDRTKVEQSEEERRRTEENRKAEEAAAEESAELARRQAEEEARAAEPPPPPEVVEPVEEEEEGRGHRRPGGHAPAPKRPEPARPSRGRDDHRQRGKLTVTRALSDEDDSRARSLAALRRAREKEKRHHMEAGPTQKQVRDVVVPEAITVQDLANRMAERGADLVKALFKMGMPVTLTQ